MTPVHPARTGFVVHSRPVPQPDEVDATADDLIAMFRAAQADIERQLASITEGRRAVRLRELRRSVAAQLTALETDARTWLEDRLPDIYALGGETAADVLGDVFVWTQPHVDALQVLASRAWDDILGATRFVARDVRAWLADQTRRQVTLSVIEGRSAIEAAKKLASAAGNELGVFTVMYKDGSRHRVADWADSAVRAVSGDTYNTGTINQSRDMGVQFMECQDGFECGLASHDDPEKPNGKIYPLDFIAGYTLSHPRCRRSIIPRIDVTSTDAEPLRTPAQIADQRASELATRAPRTPRTARSSRSSRV